MNASNCNPTPMLNLKVIRCEILGWNQERFAEALGVCKRTFIRYEQVKTPTPILRLAAHIAQAELKTRMETLCSA